MGGNSKPEQMTMNALKPGYQFTDCLCPRGNLHLREFFDPQAVSQGMCMRADSADPFEQI